MITLDNITLPAGLFWSDEYASSQVSQTVRRALDGSVVVFYGEIRAGLPITLESETDGAWLTRTQVDALALLAASPGGVYTLTLRGQTLPVMFRHQDAPAFDAKPLVVLANPRPGDYYLGTIRLMTL